MHSREAPSQPRAKWVGSFSEEGKGQAAEQGGGGRKGWAANRKGQGALGSRLRPQRPAPCGLVRETRASWGSRGNSQPGMPAPGTPHPSAAQPP